MNDQPLIDPKNLPIWTTAGFTIALLALVLALIGLYRTNAVLVATQMQIISLNKKVAEQGKRLPPAPQAPVAAAPQARVPAAPQAPNPAVK